MAKPLILQFNGIEFPVNLAKVERADLYGYIETEAVDARGRKCTTATLADDGQTLIGPGGSAFASLSADGMWLEKAQLRAVDVEGKAITPVASSYAAPVPVTKTVTIDEYLSHNVRAIYEVATESVDFAPLLAKLKDGTIYTFPYSFRGGLESDTAFLLLAADGTPFLAVGAATKLDFVSFDQAATVDDEAGLEVPEDIDFGMM